MAEHLSASQLSLYEQCPLAWRFKYVENRFRIEGDAGAGFPMRVGKLVHAALAALIKAQRGGPIIASLEGLLVGLALAQREEATSHEELAEAARILALLDGVELGFPELDATPEEKIETTIEGVPILAFIDWVRIDHISDDEVVIEVVDWKTGAGAPPPLRVLEFDPQVGLYTLIAAERYGEGPRKSVGFALEHIARGETRRITLSTEMRNYHRANIKATWRAMRRGITPARVGEHCARCDYRNTCDAFAKRGAKLARRTVAPETAAQLGDEALVAEFHATKAATKLLDARRILLEGELTKRLEQAGTTRLDVPGYRALQKSRSREEIEPHAALELTREVLGKAAALPLGAVDVSLKKLLAELPEAAATAAPLYTTTLKTTYLETRKLDVGDEQNTIE